MWQNTEIDHLTWTLWFTLRLCIYYCLKGRSARTYLFHSFDITNSNNFFKAQYPKIKIMSSGCCTTSPTNYRKKQSSESVQWTSTRHTHIMIIQQSSNIWKHKTENSFSLPLFLIYNTDRGSVHSGTASWDDCGQEDPDKLCVKSFPYCVSILCLDSIVSPLQFHWVKCVCNAGLTINCPLFGRMAQVFYILVC